MYQRLFHAVIALLIFVCWIFFGSRPIDTGNFFLPPLGSFFCPSTGFWQNAESWDEQAPPTIEVHDLMDKVDVWYNDRKVPYLYANHLIDLVKVQGYLHARNRLWQMDINIRAAAGNISQILGESALPFDRRQRNYGLMRSARRTMDRLSGDSESLRYLNAYAEGVNAYIDGLSPSEYPLEFKLLDYEPRRWKPLFTVLFMNNMRQTLAKKQQDLEHTNAIALMGRDSFQNLFPDWFPRQRPIISEEHPWNFKAVPPDTSLPGNSIALRKGEAPPPPNSRDGSNSWALSGAKTQSGSPILCNDPHLDLSLPSIWYEMQMSTPNHTVYGVSFPGAPFIIIGFNEQIAWGLTNGGHDVLNWYDIAWENREKGRYRIGDSIWQAHPFYDTIDIRAKQCLVIRRWETKFGPVWNEPGHPMDGSAMHWLANEQLDGNLFRTFFLLNQAEGYGDFKKAIQYFDCPIQNFAFASKTDTIAMHTQGAYPIKPKQYGKFILDGSSDKEIPRRYIPFKHLPHEVNPERNYVASANQHTTVPDYPYYYNGFFADYRGRYLNNTLDSIDGAGISEMKSLQNNSTSLHAIEGLKVLREYRNQVSWTPPQRDTLNRLLNWDASFHADRWEPAFFATWWNRFKQMTWDEFENNGIPLVSPEDWKLVELARDHPTHDLFDRNSTSAKEEVTDIIMQSFQKTFALWDSLYNNEGVPVNWALYNNARINHLAGLPGFSTDRLNIDGYRYALNAQSAGKGPSWRMIVHLKDSIEAYGIYPGGQSGNPGSRFYDNQLDEWKKGAYYRIDFSPDKKKWEQSGHFGQTFKSAE